ncbi:MAG: hypothetical protein U0930_23560 [Pirellulales bacterium]
MSPTINSYSLSRLTDVSRASGNSLGPARNIDYNGHQQNEVALLQFEVLQGRPIPELGFYSWSKMPKLQPMIVALLLLSCNSLAKAQTNEAKPTNWRCVIRVYELPKADASKLNLKMMLTAKSADLEISKAVIDNKTMEWLDKNANFINSSDTTLALAHDLNVEWNIRNLKPEVCRQKLTLVRKPEATGIFQLSLSTSRLVNPSSLHVDASNYSSGLPTKEANVAFRTDCGHNSSSLVVIQIRPVELADQAVNSTVVTASGQGIRLPMVPLGSFKEEVKTSEK